MLSTFWKYRQLGSISLQYFQYKNSLSKIQGTVLLILGRKYVLCKIVP